MTHVDNYVSKIKYQPKFYNSIVKIKYDYEKAQNKNTKNYCVKTITYKINILQITTFSSQTCFIDN